MCGIAGIWGPNGTIDVGAIATLMGSRLLHRGPDDSGVWVDETARLALAHRRLSIIDLTAAGHQPMESSDARYVISYNGEIYNFKDLKSEIESLDSKLRWRSTSDTEVMLEAIRLWGISTALTKFEGMFGFALWDRASRVLTLARDRLGEKPVYYGYHRGSFVFCSELKAFAALPQWSPKISPDALELYFQFGCVPGPVSIFDGVSKLGAGCYLEISINDLRAQSSPEPVSYWRLYNAAARPTYRHGHLSDSEFLYRLERTLSDAVRRQLVSDAPIGALLSGGIDSSTVVAMMQRHSSTRVQTYTVAFYEDEFSEGAYARAVARYLGTDHTELFVTPGDALEVIPKLPGIYDEPLSDTSQIPTYLVAQLASRYVKVCLSGDGGDELFGGYNRHVWGPRLQRVVKMLSPSFRRTIAQRIAQVLSRVGRERDNRSRWVSTIGFERLQKVVDALSSHEPEDVYFNLVRHWSGSTPLAQSRPKLGRPPTWCDLGDPLSTMMYSDAMWYLPDDVLVKLDRAAMATSLETRAPMLDKDVVELAYSLPTRRHIGMLHGKRLLRSMLYRHLPKTLVDRPKAGFHVPIAEWLRGPLRDWVEDLISKASLDLHGLLKYGTVQQCWREHLNGQRDWSSAIWDVVTFQSWWTTTFRSRSPAPLVVDVAKRVTRSTRGFPA
jgi:asparagine synthase (glutamine-hydrolysing)